MHVMALGWKGCLGCEVNTVYLFRISVQIFAKIVHIDGFKKVDGMSEEYMSDNFIPDPEFWKKQTYSQIWKKHKDEVLKLKNKLEFIFPVLRGAISFGLGADTDEWLKIPPNEKSEGDLKLYKNYSLFSMIEISGTDKREVSDFIWIRPDKFLMAKEKEAKNIRYWFYMVYPNATYVLTVEDIEPFKNNKRWIRIKSVPEDYILIPCDKARAEKEMFDSIKSILDNIS